MDRVPGPPVLFAFDANGTLFDDTHQFFASLIEIFAAFGKERRSEAWLRRHFMTGAGETWTSIYKSAGIAAPDEELYAMYNLAYQRQLDARPPALAPGLGMAVRWLHDRGHPAIVISTQDNAITEPLLQRAGLRDYFIELHGKVSDKDTVLISARKRFHIPAQGAFMIGDQISDGMLAANAGVKFLHREGGVHSRAQVTAALGHPVESIRNFRALPGLVLGPDSPGVARGLS